jgi:hypothetical protein
MRGRLEGWGYTGPPISDSEVRRLWEEVGNLPPAVRRLRLDPTSYPEYRRVIRRTVLELRPSIRAIERVGEAGPRHVDAATARAERTIAALRARGERVIRGSDLSPADRREMLDLLDDQCIRLHGLLGREVTRLRTVGE